ncbi:MAG: methyltransferase domain-containing protein [Chloroflexi bacterium]|nr:methyltransferase domain-containing protein [Chloroflexota bacterium]
MTLQVKLDIEKLRSEIQLKYKEVATTPEKGFHFHTGRPLARMLEYPDAWVDALPKGAVESFAGVGNPFSLGPLPMGATVLDVGSGAGFDSLIAAQQVGSAGRVIGVDMTDEMLAKAAVNARAMGLTNVEFKKGLVEELPLPDASVDVVISNGVINLVPDKEQAYREVYRVLRPGGRIQIADVVVQQEVPQDSKEDISLWTG